MNLTPTIDEWCEEPGVRDPVEARTWARLKWPVGSGSATHVRDAVAERDCIYVPLFPVARWIVANWWSLLYEVSPSMPAPSLATAPPDQRPWLQRHCLRTADASLLLPNLSVFSRGHAIQWSLQRDESGHALRYLDTSQATVTREHSLTALGTLVQAVLERLHGVNDTRVVALRDDWYATRRMPEGEMEFCRAAGRLGLDPMDVGAWPEGVLEWIEQAPDGQLDSAFAIDVLEAGDAPADKPELERALRQLSHRLDLRAGPAPSALDVRGTSLTEGYEVGYELALQVRRRLQIAPFLRFGADLADVSQSVHGVALRQETSGLPSGQVVGLAGWRSGALPTIAIRPSGTQRGRRFAASRSLYFALWAAVRGPRVVTDAKTWEQQASRAFAAELLAPREAVLERVERERRAVGIDEAIDSAAEHFDVSPTLIGHQHYNALLLR